MNKTTRLKSTQVPKRYKYELTDEAERAAQKYALPVDLRIGDEVFLVVGNSIVTNTPEKELISFSEDGRTLFTHFDQPIDKDTRLWVVSGQSPETVVKSSNIITDEGGLALQRDLEKEIADRESAIAEERTAREDADAALDAKIEAIETLKFRVVDELPETGEAGIIYLVPKEGETPDVYDEYIWVDGSYEKIGSTEVKLDDYVLKSEIFNLGQSESGIKYIDGVKIAAAPGMPATASGYGVAIGNGATSGSAPSIAVGSSASSTSNGFEAIGNGSAASSQGRAYAGGNASSGAIAFGGTATNAGVSVGPGGNASNQGIAIGSNSSSKATATGGNNSIAIGYNTSSTNGGYEAIGSGSNASNSGRAYAGGTAYNTSSIAVGGTSNGGGSVSFGVSSSSTGGASSAIGYLSTASASAATAVGTSAKASAQNAVAVGAGAQATSTDSVAIRGNASYNNAVSIGASAVASSYSAVALGQSAAAKGYNGVAIGPSATVDSSANGSVAIGQGSRATADATVSFGSSSFKRRLVNVAPATADNDAVVLSQLNNTASTLNARIDVISVENAADLLIVEPAYVDADGIAKDFQYGGGYLQMPYPLGAYGEYFTLWMTFTTGSDVTTEQSLIDSKYGLSLFIKNGHFVMAASSNGTSWDIGSATGTIAVKANTEYDIRLERNNLELRLRVVDDGAWEVDISIDVDSATVLNQAITYLGGANSTVTGREAHPFKGTINLKKTRGGMGVNDHGEATYNNGWWWSAAGSVGLQTKANTSLTNLDAIGEERIKEIAGGASYDTYPNATIIGNPTINGGQVSGFSTTNYLQFPFIFDLTGKTFQIDFCFTTGNDVSVQQNIIDSDFGIALAISGNKGLMAISSNGTSWNIGTAVGTFEFEESTTYYARLSWDGSVYKTALSTDGETFTDDMSIASTTAPFPTTHYIGGASDSIVGHTVHPFGGIIDLNKCEMHINDELVWEGMDSLGLRTRADVSLSNIDAAGEEKIREVMAPIIGNIEAILAELNSGEGV